jgi:hypothetical protein
MDAPQGDINYVNNLSTIHKLFSNLMLSFSLKNVRSLLKSLHEPLILIVNNYFKN